MDPDKSVYRLKRALLGCVLGTLLAAGFYHGVLIDLGINEEILRHFKDMLVVTLGIACALSERVQCVGLICTAFFCSRNGRRTLQAMLFTLIITGPGYNMISNTKEALRTFGCAAELAFNISKDYTYLAVTPFTNAILEMDHQNSAESVTNAVQSMQNQIRPIKKAIASPLEEKLEDSENTFTVAQKYKFDDSDTDGDIIEKKFKKKVELQCLNAIKNSSQNCKEIFEKTYDECAGKVSEWVSWILCWPMKVDYVCDLTWLVVGKAPCDAQRNVNRGFGAAFNTLNASDHSLNSTLGKPKFRYKLPDPDLREGVHDVASSTKTIVAEVKAKAEGAELLLSLLAKVVALMFLPTILESVKYLNNYLQRPGYDNIFITKQFEALDTKRAREGRDPVLLPLRRMEKKNLVLNSVWLPNGPEKRNYFSPCFRLLLLLFIVMVVWTTDHLYYKTLMVVADHGKFNVTLMGNHSVHIKVSGTGFVAKLVRTLIKSFNSNAFVEQSLSNEHCLPHPKKLQIYYNVKIFVIFLLMVLFALLDHLPKRMRNTICAWYYPKRESQRTVFLYNKLLKTRVQWREIVKRTVNAQKEEMQSADRCFKENTVFKKTVKLIANKWWKLKRCTLCSVEESKSEHFVKCRNCALNLYFCLVCWKEIDFKCFICSNKTIVK